MSTDLNKPIAAPEPTLAELREWEAVQIRMDIDKAREMELRKKIAAFYFPDPKEGTNSAPFPHAEGWVVKLNHKISRKLDMPLLTTNTEKFNEAKIPLASLVVPKYELSMKVYNTLTDEQKKLFEVVLESKPGAPSVEIVKPKNAS
jgi:hypothetical protein